MENKKISIDLEHFKLPSGGGSRKRRSNAGNSDGGDGGASIRVRPPPKPKDHNRTTKRNALLKFIRRHQDHNYRRMMGEESRQTHDTSSMIGGGGGGEAKTDLDDTLDYLMNLADEVKEEQDQHYNNTGPASVNHTLKRNPIQPRVFPPFPGEYESGGVIFQRTTNGIPSEYENVSTEFPIPTASNAMPSMQLQPPRLHPKYGCLKGGSLPTYRTYMNNNNSHSLPPSSLAPSPPPLQSQPHQFLPQTPHVRSSDFGYDDDVHGGQGGGGDMDNKSSNVKLKYVRQKRTNRRTFKIGKSTTRPKVGVLISNRTIRKHIANQSHELKQTSMHEIRRFLVKHGLIKVGTSSPNEVLRKMYESAQMMCGEVYNHNTDTLLHNFIHQS